MRWHLYPIMSDPTRRYGSKPHPKSLSEIWLYVFPKKSHILLLSAKADANHLQACDPPLTFDKRQT